MAKLGTSFVFFIERDEHVLVAERGVVAEIALQVGLFCVDEGPDFIALKVTRFQTPHVIVQEDARSVPGLHAKPHDGVAVNAGKAFRGSDGIPFDQHVFDQHVKDGLLLVGFQGVHSWTLPRWGGSVLELRWP